ncbi:MAG: PTS N-acetylgalactosamine transporter subunit IID [Erysipelotrichaceae bacterium]|jgi:PTS system galactosamine-specific IID component|nr:PTS N-acetylgalactosamine transporter subunit IID [Erysipelotrichaceae bacterium]
MTKKAFERALTKSDITRMSIRTLLNQATFNFERMQSIGFTASFAPELKKIYGDDTEGLAKALSDNLEFINTHNVTLAFLIGVMLSLYEKHESLETIRNIKVSLFGPLAGVGDAVFWFTLTPIMAGICASFANDGNILGPILYFLVFFGCFLLRIPLGHIGYTMGTKAFDIVSKNIARVNKAASILACTILGGLIASYISINVATSIPVGDSVVSLQTDFFDHIIPNFLPFVFTFFIYSLVRKKVSATTLILCTLVASIVLAYFKVLAP